MSSFPILDLVVGMIFIFFLLSIICSSATELWFSIRRTRARLLEKWLMRIFDTKALKPDGTTDHVTLGQAIMDHCMARALSSNGKSSSYINAQNFVSALLDKITITPAPGNTTIQMPPKDLSEYINLIQNSTVISGELKRTILIFAHEAKQATDIIKNLPANVTLTTSVKSELDDFRERLENWYDTNGERLTANFKRTKVLPVTFITAIIITVLLNADSVAIGRYLYQNKEASRQLADQALATVGKYKERIERMKNDTGTATPGDFAAMKRLDDNLVQLRQDIGSLKNSMSVNLPLGWKNGRVDPSEFGKHIIGWIASVLAICLGAPFWFDILNKIANLRGSGARPATDKNEKK